MTEPWAKIRSYLSKGTHLTTYWRKEERRFPRASRSLIIEMSFGFSVGDFLAVIQIVAKIQQSYADASDDFKSVAKEVQSLRVVLQGLHDVLPSFQASPQEQSDLDMIVTGCKAVLADVEKRLDKYKALQSSGGDWSTRVGRKWKKLTWDPDKIRDLRGQITLHVTMLNAFFGSISRRGAFTLSKGIDQVKDSLSDQDRLRILDWLTPIDYGPQQSDFLSRKQAGTGQWLLDSMEFKSWVHLGSNRQTLFCAGIPGAGKTILTSIIIDDLYRRFETDKSIGIAYIYCNFRRPNEQEPDQLSASLLKQLSQTMPSLPEGVVRLHEKHRDLRTRPSLQELLTTLEDVMKMYSAVFILVDALDECQATTGQRTKFLQGIFELQSKVGTKVLATSRPIPDIAREFEGSLELEIQATEDDIRRYVEGRIHQSRFIHRDPQLREEAVKGIVKSAQGMFLLAQLHLDALLGTVSKSGFRSTLERLPTGFNAYDSSYKDAMNRIERQIPSHQMLAKQVLCWITRAKRVLKVLELQHALAVDSSDRTFDEDKFPDSTIMVSVCAGLVTIDRESNVIRLVHYTTQEYFERTRNDWFPDGEFEMARICATYLSMEVFESGLCLTWEAYSNRVRVYAFYEYAASNWGHHACEALRFCKEVVEFLQSEQKANSSHQAERQPKRTDFANYALRQFDPWKTTGLHQAAYFGIEYAARPLLDCYDLDAADDNYSTPLIVATQNGHESIVKMLLDSHANVNARDCRSRTALFYAAEVGHETIVDLLLSKEEVNVNTSNLWGDSPLLLAAEKGHEAVIELLLATGEFDGNACDDKGRAPLSLAAENGHEYTVKRLLAREKIDANREDDEGRTPLGLAAQYGHKSICELLLEAGADVHIKDEYGFTPLFWAAIGGCEATLGSLFGATAQVDVDSKDQDGRTPLSFAAERGHRNAVELLLATGKVNVNSRSAAGRTPLSYAAEAGYWGVVRLLLKTPGVEVDAKDNNGRTPLSWTAGEPNRGVPQVHDYSAKLLLRTGKVDVNAMDSAGRTPLSWAAQTGICMPVGMELLEQKNIDVEAKDKAGMTPLVWAIKEDHADTVALLLYVSTSKDGTDPTAMIRAVERTHEAIAAQILDMKQGNGQTTLDRAIAQGHDAVVQLLQPLLDVGPLASNEFDGKDGKGA